LRANAREASESTRWTVVDVLPARPRKCIREKRFRRISQRVDGNGSEDDGMGWRIGRLTHPFPARRG